MKYSVIDTHSDTLSKLYKEGGSLYNNTCQVDLARLRDMGVTYFFAAFVDPKSYDNPRSAALGMIRLLKNEVAAAAGELVLCTSYEDYARSEGKARAFLSLEGATAIESVEDLHTFYNEGVRMLSLTWNNTNHLGAGAMERDTSRGLTEFGREIICEMNRLGILVDVSHASDRTFWDIAELSKAPIIASHSNSRRVCEHVRNLSDDQVAAIKKSRGYIGINLFPPFLSGGGAANIEDILRHTDRFLSLGAEDLLGIGADFDGVDALPEGISGAWDLYKVFDRMLRHGYSEELVNKISHKNMERILHENL